jgi:hypothetical protein
MASSAPNRSLVARAAAILTTAEVAGAALDLNEGWGGNVGVQLDFTKGSLTNVIIRHYVSMDGTNWYPVYTEAGAQATETITADATRSYKFGSLGGWKFFRSTVQGTGTVTSSSAALTYRYLRRGSQG